MICRLCIKNSDNFYNFFDTEGFKMKIVSIIAKHFWFEPKLEDDASHLICTSCWITTKKFHELYLLVEKTWTTGLPLIKEDSCNYLVDSNGMCHENGHKREIFKNKEDGSIQVNKSYSSFELDPKFEISEIEDLKSQNCITVSNIQLEENLDKANTKKRGKSSNTNKSFKIKQSKSNSKINCNNKINDDYESEIANKNDVNQIHNFQAFEETRKKKEPKSKFLKRTAEETAEFNKKVAEGDALIGKFMKIVCNFCSEEQKNFTSFKQHCTSVHGEKGWVICCDKRFSKKINLVEHIERHVEPEKYKCHICSNVSGSRRSLKAHIINKHSKEEPKKPHKCLNCGKAFRLKFILMRHELTHIPEEERKFKCPQCDKNFPALYSLKSHIRLVHDGQYAGVCDICGKAYNNREMLKQHRLKVHEGVDPKFKCKYCDKEFTSRFVYNTHKFREHENTNPNIDFKCPMCDKTSKTFKAITNHIHYVHKAKKKFKCTLCSKVFKRELDLKEHVATHTGQSLYSCLHCPRSFTHSSNMIKHIKLKHPLEFEEARQKKDEKKTWIEKTRINL